MSELTGTANADELILTGADQVFTLEGDDVIWFPEGNAEVVWGASIDGGDGYDTIDASHVATNLRIVEIGTPTYGVPVTTVAGIEHIVGGSGNDIVVMLYNQSGVSIEGGAGTDILMGGSADDQLDGGIGLDISAYLSMYRGATVAFSHGNGTVTTQAGGTDTLQSIEYTAFVDGILTTDQSSPAAQVARMYAGLFGRSATAAELDDGTHALQHGTSLASLIHDLATSSDSLGFGSTSDAGFVEGLYHSVLGRAADQDGHDYWMAALAGGASREAVVAGFTESSEFRANTADALGTGLFVTDEDSQFLVALYDTMADRLADQQGFGYWLAKLKTGALTATQVAECFANSTEFHTATDGMSNSTLVDYLSMNSYGHAANVDVRAAFVTALDNGMSRGDLIQDFAIAAEHLYLISSDIHGGVAIAAA